MTDDIFQDERVAMERCQALLKDDCDLETLRPALSDFFDEHERVLKMTRRLVRLSDKREERLNDARRELELRNKILEGLSQKLSKYLSPTIYKSIFEGVRDVRPEGRRKKLTIFFSDIADFTETAERLEAEDLVHFLNAYISEMTDIAIRYGATIDKYIGDAIMLFFGDPETRGVKTDAVQCVRMALAMQDRLTDMEDEWRAEGFVRPFRVRMGINTGFCTVGNFGSETKLDYTIVGSHVNLAARLQTKSPVGGVLVSEETWSVVADQFVGERFGELTVKGVPYPVASYLVKAERDPHKTGNIRQRREGVDLAVNLDGMTPLQMLSNARLLANVARQLEEQAKKAGGVIDKTADQRLDDLLFGSDEPRPPETGA